jgi:hypothetical protein
MTMGIVVVACWAKRIAGALAVTITSTLHPDQLSGQLGQRFDTTASGPVFDGDLLAVAQTMRGKPVPQVVEQRAIGIDKRRQHTDDRPPLRCSWRND